MRVFKKIVKNLQCKDNGRSSDQITPSFIFGCAFQCQYCYFKRNNPDTVQVAENLDQILQAIDLQSIKYKWEKEPNQCDPKYYIQDIGCNVDVSLHWKHLDWVKVFDFYRSHNKLKATFATKYVNEKMLSYNPDKKVRIRFSLIPNLGLEPHTSSFEDKVLAINKFWDAGYEVHINWSPVIIKDNWLEDYKRMFNFVDENVREDVKKDCFSEVIFLTHNERHHFSNLNKGLDESLLWNPEIQENKVSSYGSENVRYKYNLKHSFINEFKKEHQRSIPWNRIRYIF